MAGRRSNLRVCLEPALGTDNLQPIRVRPTQTRIHHIIGLMLEKSKMSPETSIFPNPNLTTSKKSGNLPILLVDRHQSFESGAPIAKPRTLSPNPRSRNESLLDRFNGLMIEQKLFCIHQSPDNIFIGDSGVFLVLGDMSQGNFHFFGDWFAGINPAVQFTYLLLMRSLRIFG